MRSLAYIAMSLCLVGCISKKEALDDKAVTLQNDREDIMISPSKAWVESQNLSIVEDEYIHRIKSINARKRAQSLSQSLSFSTNYTNPTPKAEGGSNVLFIPSATRTSEDFSRPNSITSRHERMTQEVRSSFASRSAGGLYFLLNPYP